MEFSKRQKSAALAVAIFLWIFINSGPVEFVDFDVCGRSPTANTSVVLPPAQRISNQKEHPFLINGAPVLRSNPRFNEFSKSIRKFPDVRSCLNGTELASKKPDLTNFNWAAMTQEPYIDVCLFRVMDSLNSPEAGQLWFESQGLNSKIYSTKYLGKELIQTTGTNFTRTTGKLYKNERWLAKCLIPKLLYAEGMSVSWLSDGGIFNTYYNSSSK